MPPKPNARSKKKLEQLTNEIKKMRKKPANLLCCECSARSTPYICLDFSTFICTGCSGIHREFNHRVKSIAMATFNEKEVQSLRDSGNEYINRRYLARYKKGKDPFQMPHEGEKERIKQLIELKYKTKKWYKENPKMPKKKKKKKKKRKVSYSSEDSEGGEQGQQSNKNTNNKAPAQKPPQQKPKPQAQQAKPQPKVQTQPQTQAQPMEDLFDFNATAATTTAPGNAWNTFDADGGQQTQGQSNAGGGGGGGAATTNWDPWSSPTTTGNANASATNSQSNTGGSGNNAPVPATNAQTTNDMGWSENIFGEATPMKPKPVSESVKANILSGYEQQRQRTSIGNAQMSMNMANPSMMQQNPNMVQMNPGMVNPMMQAQQQNPNGGWGMNAQQMQMQQQAQQQQQQQMLANRASMGNVMGGLPMNGNPMMQSRNSMTMLQNPNGMLVNRVPQQQQQQQMNNPLFSAISVVNQHKEAEMAADQQKAQAEAQAQAVVDAKEARRQQAINRSNNLMNGGGGGGGTGGGGGGTAQGVTDDPFADLITGMDGVKANETISMTAPNSGSASNSSSGLNSMNTSVTQSVIQSTRTTHQFSTTNNMTQYPYGNNAQMVNTMPQNQYMIVQQPQQASNPYMTQPVANNNPYGNQMANQMPHQMANQMPMQNQAAFNPFR